MIALYQADETILKDLKTHAVAGLESFVGISAEDEKALLAREDIAMWSCGYAYNGHQLCGIMSAPGWGRSGQAWLSMPSYPELAVPTPSRMRDMALANDAMMRSLLPIVQRPIHLVHCSIMPPSFDDDYFLVAIVQQANSSCQSSKALYHQGSAYYGRHCILKTDDAWLNAARKGALPESLTVMRKKWAEMASVTSEVLAGKHEITEGNVSAVYAQAFRNNYTDINNHLERLRSQLADHERRYREMYNEYMSRKSQLAGLQDIIDGKRSIDLPPIPGIKLITAISDTHLLIETEELPLQYVRDGKLYTHDLGRFLVVFSLTNLDLHCYNITRHIGTNGGYGIMNAPHVWEAGNVCLGNTGYLFTEALKQMDLAGALSLVVTYLQSANLSDSAGRHAPEWPLSSVQDLSKAERAAMPDSADPEEVAPDEDPDEDEGEDDEDDEDE